MTAEEEKEGGKTKDVYCPCVQKPRPSRTVKADQSFQNMSLKMQGSPTATIYSTANKSVMLGTKAFVRAI